jgi:hypothetical protein
MGLLVFSLVGLAAIAGGFFWWQGQQDEEGTPENTEATGPQTPGEGGSTAAPVVDDAPPPTKPLTNLPAGDGEAGAAPEDPAANSGGSDAATPPADTGAGESDPGETTTPPPAANTPPSAEFVVPGVGEPIETRGITDVNVLDLMAVPLLPKFSGSSDEEFAEMVEDLEIYLEDGGAQSNRAGKRVVESGRAAFPVILNAMLRLDYSSQEGNYTGGTLNTLLYQAGNENKNFAWNSTQLFEVGGKEFNDAALLNKKIVGTMQRYWVNQLSSDDKAWENWITKTAPKEGE